MGVDAEQERSSTLSCLRPSRLAQGGVLRVFALLK